MALNYRQSGVDIEAGDALVHWLKRTANPKAPMNEHIVSGIGGFAALFQIPEISRQMQRPSLVSATDGVGTKLRLAIDSQRYEGVGQDLVAMCVNDLICCGGQPLFFLDYYATGKLDVEAAQRFLSGVRLACEESGMALIGGETAEMPGMYSEKDFDCAGFAVGLVDADETWGAQRVRPGDQVIGISSSGCHSNGYSLLRKVFAEDIEQWRDELLVPTALYPRLVQGLDVATSGIHAMAHITGGGMDNVARVLPDGLHFQLSEWQWPAIFLEVQRRTEMSRVEMMKTLNCGVGMVMIIDPAHKGSLTAQIEKKGYSWQAIGTVVSGEGAAQVHYPQTSSLRDGKGKSV